MILIIAALEEEYQALEDYINNKEEGIIRGIKYHKGSIANKECLLILSGVGKVNASYSLTTILNNFKIDFVVNIGSAGGVISDYQVNVYDVVIADRVCQHDVDLMFANRKMGELPNLPQYFEASLNDKMIKVIKDLGLSYHIATIASGDQFVCELAKVNNIINHFDNVCAIEMEAGAIAQICYMNKIPFVITRAISDVVNDNSDNQEQFDKFILQAASNSAKLAYALIECI